MKFFYIYTFGCKINQYESQLIKQKYIDNGYTFVDNINSADTVIVNSCSVTAYADKECNQLIKKLVSKNKKILLTGCYAKVFKEQILKEFPDITIILKEEILKEIKQEIKTFDNHSRAFVKIQDGCNSFCSYCIVPYARNIFWSKPVNDVIEEINHLLDMGYAEIVLTGIHIGKYDKGIDFLLSEIFKNIKRNFRIRLSSIEMHEITNNLKDIIKNEPVRMARHLHIPLQSGCNKILKDMNRKYSAEQFCNTLNNLKNLFPDIAITTDVICGFPTETDEDFDITYNFIRNNKFARLHVFPYSRRSGTVAYNLRPVYKDYVLKQRTDKLLELDKTLRKEYFKKFIGTTRKAVSLRNNQALTDNYLTIKDVDKQNSIFDVVVK